MPANSCTPMIANISQKIRHTSNTLKIDGMAWTKALTTTYGRRSLIKRDITHWRLIKRFCIYTRLRDCHTRYACNVCSYFNRRSKIHKIYLFYMKPSLTVLYFQIKKNNSLIQVLFFKEFIILNFLQKSGI